MSSSFASDMHMTSVSTAVSSGILFLTNRSLLPQLTNDLFLSRFVKVNVKCFIFLSLIYLTTPVPLTSSTFTVHIPFFSTAIISLRHLFMRLLRVSVYAIVRTIILDSAHIPAA